MGVDPGWRKVLSRLLNADLDWQTNVADPYLGQVSVGHSIGDCESTTSLTESLSLFRDGDLPAEFHDRPRGWRPG